MNSEYRCKYREHHVAAEPDGSGRWFALWRFHRCEPVGSVSAETLEVVLAEARGLVHARQREAAGGSLAADQEAVLALDTEMSSVMDEVAASDQVELKAEVSPAHTPGPWFVYENGHCVGGPFEPSLSVPGVGHEGNTAGVPMCGMRMRTFEEAEANARLISAAPELLARCEMVLSLAYESGCGWRAELEAHQIEEIRAAVAVAKGVHDGRDQTR